MDNDLLLPYSMDNDLLLPFGIKEQSLLTQLGTKGDVLTFFSVLDDLINRGYLQANFPTVTNDLKNSCIHLHNIDDFKEQTEALAKALEEIPTDVIDWNKFPISNGKLAYDLSKPNLFALFEKKYFNLFKEYIEYIPIAQEEGYKIFPMYVSPIHSNLSRKYKKMTPDDFLAQAHDPYWLKEPFVLGTEEKVFVHYIDASKK